MAKKSVGGEIRWPVTVKIREKPVTNEQVANWRPGDAPIHSVAGLVGVIDRAGRYYFRPDDVEKDWFKPGWVIERQVIKAGALMRKTEIIKTVEELFDGDDLAAIQVTSAEQ